MDKRIIFAVAGSGKSTLLINKLNKKDRVLLITYTVNNTNNLISKVVKKFGYIPNNIKISTYFSFLYKQCFKPLFGNKTNAKGITHKTNPNRFVKKTEVEYYMSKSGRMYGNRLGLFIMEQDEKKELVRRLEKFYDKIFIDEVQDFGGHDFNFLLFLSQFQKELLCVGDFSQHTFDTSKDGKLNTGIYKDFTKYTKKLSKSGFIIDQKTLNKSWRCSPTTCEFVAERLDIPILSHKQEETIINFIEDVERIRIIMNDQKIIKLFYSDSIKYRCESSNWGASKGKGYKNIAIILNQKTLDYYLKDKLIELPQTTKNKLYVALTRAEKNIYLIPHSKVKEYKVD